MDRLEAAKEIEILILVKYFTSNSNKYLHLFLENTYK